MSKLHEQALPEKQAVYLSYHLHAEDSLKAIQSLLLEIAVGLGADFAQGRSQEDMRRIENLAMELDAARRTLQRLIEQR